MLSVVGVALVWTSLTVSAPLGMSGLAATPIPSAGPARFTATWPTHHSATGRAGTATSGSAASGSATSGNSTTVTTPLTRGDRGPRVVDVQRALLANGLSVRGGADGIFGPATAQALLTFQTSSGLRATGTVDPTTAHLLGLGPAPVLPRRGDRGDAVAALQRALLGAGTNVRGGADGVFGAATEIAVASFQTARGLSSTGQVDVRTAIALGIAPQGEAPTVDTPATQDTSAQTTSTQNTSAQTTNIPSVALPRRGQTSDAVAVLQRALIAAGVSVRGGADGIFGAATERALKVYQHGVRRPATGTLDDITAQLLGLLPGPSVPRRGDRGDDVVAIQTALITRGISVRGGADGVFGAATERAISTFQAARGLSTTGRLDLVTYFAITAGDASDTSAPSSNGAPSSSTGSSNTSTGTSPIAAQIFPVQGPCWFTDTWHAPRSGGRRHLGVDIIAPRGKAVYAVVDGVITRTFADRPGSLGGNALRLTASDGTYFHYAHFSTFADGIELGSDVVAGQIIGYVGSTGSSSTPHLHFEYHPFGGAAVNPYPMVKKLDACKVVDVLPQPGDIRSSTDSSSASSSDE